MTQTITFDAKFHMKWLDTRLNLTHVYDLEHDALENTSCLSTHGIEIKELVYSQANPLEIWRPNMHFIDAQSESMIGETIVLLPDGYVFWSRHLVLTVTQPIMDFRNYPMDKHSFRIHFEAYQLNTDLLVFEFATPAVSLFVNEYGHNFKKNALWNYIGYESTVQVINYGTDAYPINFSVGELSLILERNSDGMILRLAVPILLLLVLCGINFWSNRNERVNISITLLLAVSALYIVIFASMPMVGYMTMFDDYCFSMFMILFLCTCIQQYTYKIECNSREEHDKQIQEQEQLGKEGKEKVESISTFENGRICKTLTFFDSIARIFVTPIVIFIFMISFQNAYQPSTIILVYIFCIIYILFVIYLEYSNMKSFILLFRNDVAIIPNNNNGSNSNNNNSGSGGGLPIKNIPL